MASAGCGGTATGVAIEEARGRPFLVGLTTDAPSGES
jgi:hypothetical protein